MNYAGALHDELPPTVYDRLVDDRWMIDRQSPAFGWLVTKLCMTLFKKEWHAAAP